MNASHWSSLLGWTLWFSFLGGLHAFTHLARVRCYQLVSSTVARKRDWLRMLLLLGLLFLGVAFLVGIGLRFCIHLSDVVPAPELVATSGSSGLGPAVAADDNDTFSDESSKNEQASDAYEFQQLVHILIFIIAEAVLLLLMLMHILTTLVVHALGRFSSFEFFVSTTQTTVLYNINLFFDVACLAVDLGNHLHMLIWSRILSIVSLIILFQIRLSYTELSQRLRQHFMHRRLVNYVQSQYPSELFAPKPKDTEALASSTEDSEPEPCAICWEPLFTWRKLPCSHCFHESCLIAWMEENPSCPTCRHHLFPRQPGQRARTARTVPAFGGFFDGRTFEPHPNAEPANTGLLRQQTIRTYTFGQVQPIDHSIITGSPSRSGASGTTFVANAVVAGQSVASALNVSVHFALGSGTRLAAVVQTPIGSTTSSLLQSSAQRQTVQISAESVTLGTDQTDHHQPEDTGVEIQLRPVAQSTIRRQFFNFDGARYFRWLPSIRVELSEVTGDLLRPPQDAVEDTMPPDGQPVTVDVQQSTTTPTADAPTPTTSAGGRFFSSLRSMFSSASWLSASPVLPRLSTSELQAQANHIAEMFSAISPNDILLDLTTSGAAELTVENILSGRLAPSRDPRPSVINVDVPCSSAQTGSTTSVISQQSDTQIHHRVFSSSSVESMARHENEPSSSTGIRVLQSESASASQSNSASSAVHPSPFLLLAQRKEQLLAEARRKYMSRKR